MKEMAILKTYFQIVSEIFAFVANANHHASTHSANHNSVFIVLNDTMMSADGNYSN